MKMMNVINMMYRMMMSMQNEITYIENRMMMMTMMRMLSLRSNECLL